MVYTCHIAGKTKSMGTYRILMKKCFGKRPFERKKNRWKADIKKMLER
jgi:hypothetical protein